MSRKHPHRAGNQPVTRRYVAGVVRRARDEIISTIVNAQPVERDIPWRWDNSIAAPSPERIERAVDG